MNVVADLLSKVVLADNPKATHNELTLEYYEIYISEGIHAAMRGEFSKITEIYIPELKLAINQGLSPVNVFLVTYDRYTNKGSSMSRKDIKLLKPVIINRESEVAKNLLWLEDCLKNKKKRQVWRNYLTMEWWMNILICEINNINNKALFFTKLVFVTEGGIYGKCIV